MSTGQNQIVKVEWVDGFAREFTFARPEEAQNFARALLGGIDVASVASRVNGTWQWFPGTEGTHFAGKPL